MPSIRCMGVRTDRTMFDVRGLLLPGACLRRGNALGALWPWFTLKCDPTGAVVGGSGRLPGAGKKKKTPGAPPSRGALLALAPRRWARRVPECPFVFHRDGHRRGRFDA